MSDAVGVRGVDAAACGGALERAGVFGGADASAHAGAPVLELRDVGFAYGGHEVLRGLSLAAVRGRLTGIVGPNGCGKSTLLRLADGVLAPLAGSVLVEGREVRSYAARERAARIALLPQIHRTPSMTVEALVACGRYAHMGPFGALDELDRQVVAEAMRLARVDGLAHKAARSLSGGERQRAFIAMVLAQQAQTVLLDEPTTYLDPRAALDVMELVQNMVREQGRTAVAVLHDLPLALRFCDRIAVMDAGTVVAMGAPDEIVAQGVLERVFGVSVARVERGGSPVYFCY